MDLNTIDLRVIRFLAVTDGIGISLNERCTMLHSIGQLCPSLDCTLSDSAMDLFFLPFWGLV